VIRSTGKPFSNFKTSTKKQRPFNITYTYIDLGRDILYKRINDRVDDMVKAGLLEEVERLTDFQHLQALQTVGYSEFFDYLNNKITYKEAVEKIKQHSRNYAKRQITWFKKFEV
jgi:tRNA dimethylallyltransferase